MARPRKTRKQKRSSRKHTPCALAADFYSANNDQWIRDTELPATESRVTQAYFIREDINKELDTIIDSTTDGPIHTLMSSWKHAEIHQKPGITPIIQLMMAIKTPEDVVSRIGWMNRYGIACPLAIYIQGDPRDHSHCRVFIEEGEPRIGIPEYWSYPEYTGHRAAYKRYIHHLASITGLSALRSGFDAEREFVSVYPRAVERRQTIDTYTWAELCSEYRQIDWTAMFDAWGLRGPVLGKLRYNVTSKAFLHHIQQRLARWSAERWAGWFALTVVQWIAGMSPHGPLRAAWFTFNQRFLQGAPTDNTARELRHAIVRTMVPNTLGKLWVRRYCSSRLKRDVTAMAERIRTAAAITISKSWMEPSTRAAAVRKLKALNIQICWPDLDLWRSHEVGCGLSETNYIDNLLAIAAAATDENIDIIRRHACRKPLGANWGRPVYEVNAFYYPDENRFLLPAAILRPPFYDARRSTAWNYGAIGATIGHELCHAFDSSGRFYDERGDKHSWWTANDDREYRRRAAAVARLYESRDYRGMDVDGDLTLTENIADLGGLEFAMAGLRSELGREPTKAEKRDFFQSYAISWRSKDRLKRAAQLLVSDFHAPPMLRVNHAVRQMNEWYEAFDVGADCDDYIAPDHRIHFFS